ncbi:hypothetical protein [Francisella sp. LA112445]|uniref:hypothetical protein n=1 Tax=Francisella sp. LA112445 TaxID=1395624 RepID=UPI001788AC3E|nr:hypothetical protein [Francisella sp. LA112445]QIW10745.1 hypothetical protein FIP56_08565 [Francisella sp. LA112445]
MKKTFLYIMISLFLVLLLVFILMYFEIGNSRYEKKQCEVIAKNMNTVSKYEDGICFLKMNNTYIPKGMIKEMYL